MTRKLMLITGASAGIGAATARLAAARGYDVALNYASNAKAAEALADELSRTGVRALPIQADVADPVQIEAMFEGLDAFGTLDALVNNAGIVMPVGPLEDIDHARLRRIFDVNVIGSFLCAREAVLRMSQKHGGEGGAIVNLTSVSARLGSPDTFIDYAATKGAIDSFTTGLALEQAAHGVRVNAVRPGIIETDIHAKSGDPERVERMAEGIPMRRAGTAEEVAEAILWLCSDAASYVTGTTIDVSGGR